MERLIETWVLIGAAHALLCLLGQLSLQRQLRGPCVRLQKGPQLLAEAEVVTIADEHYLRSWRNTVGDFWLTIELKQDDVPDDRVCLGFERLGKDQFVLLDVVPQQVSHSLYTILSLCDHEGLSLANARQDVEENRLFIDAAIEDGLVGRARHRSD